jgi:2-keto-4-pentenoate hydratase/2-oxohepta-3-ene-1,7-dioic acid hydratase in catechol pathway
MTIAEQWGHTFGITHPGTIVCVGLNYRAHTSETALAQPEEPLLFGKFSNSLINTGEAIRLPPSATHVDAEAELAIVIGAHAVGVSQERALDFVAGYTVANDVSARDLQFADGQ